MADTPKRSKGDIVHSVAKSGLSAIPIFGGAAVELFESVIQPPLEKRRDEWREQVGEKLKKLEDDGLKLEDLRENEEFISALMHASQIAIRTHHASKLTALRNAVANVAKGQGPDEALQHVFLNLVDSFTELHLRILKVSQSPESPPGLAAGALSHVLEHNLPELKGNSGLYVQLWKDLFSRGLVNTDGLHGTMTERGLAEKRTTPLGDRFLAFINEPR